MLDGRSPFRRAFRKVQRAAAWPVSRIKIGWSSRELRRFQPAQHVTPPHATPDLSVLMSYRVHNQERLSILSAVIRALSVQLAGLEIAIHIVDCSTPEMRAQVSALWDASPLDVRRTEADISLCEALWMLLSSCESRWFYLQFDDMITAGLDRNFLAGACELLGSYEGLIDVVCPFWPLERDFLEESHRVHLVSHEVSAGRRPRYRFTTGGLRAPVVEGTFSGRQFGVFENFTYGFFFNNLVAPTEDFRRRMSWYRQHVSSESVHRIEEVAAAKLTGPFWRHVGVCLDGAAILDVDFAHTAAAVRPEVPDNLRSWKAVMANWQIDVAAQVASRQLRR